MMFRQVLDCHQRVLYAVGEQLRVGDLEEYHSVDTHGHVILGDHGLRGEIRYLFL